VEGIAYAVNHAGLYRFIAKPWAHEGLITTIREAIQIYAQEQELLRQHEALQTRAMELERLNQQLSQLKTAFDMLQQGVTVSDLDGVILYANQADAAMHGYTVEELLGWMFVS